MVAKPVLDAEGAAEAASTDAILQAGIRAARSRVAAR
jgi:hypothetical protein